MRLASNIPVVWITAVSEQLVEGERVAGRICPIDHLCPPECEQMYTLLASYFHNVTPGQFEQDLAEKEWAILLTDTGAGRIRGFSTLMRLRLSLDGQPITAFFSGDTIVERDYWGETLLPRLWARHVFSLAQTVEVGRVYWFLICSGYKTYRCLPVFFREFYPTYQQPTPPEMERLLDRLGNLKFPGEYEAGSGIVRFKQAAPLRAGVAEITSRRLKDPHVAFFATANPGHLQGDELVCLAELTPANLTPAGQRMAGIGGEGPG